MGISSKNFSAEELSCSHCGENKFDQKTLDSLQGLRDAMKKPLKLSSAYRCSVHNQNVSSSGPDGPHTTGKAIDILCSGKDAHEILSFAMIRSNTWKGIGISQKGKHSSRFIHLDTIEADNRPWVWSY
jgi:zinc D-Ala-D-Ala carboxypeptidase